MVFLVSLLLTASFAWAEGPLPGGGILADPPSFESAASFTGGPVTPAKLKAQPWFVASRETMSAKIALLCIACREFVPTCRAPGHVTGKACGDGNPPDTCTCKKCNGTFGCFP